MEGIRYRGVFGTISTMIRTEGPRSLYNGLVAGLQRQLCFASVRIGLYDNVKNFYTGGKDSKYFFFIYNTEIDCHIWMQFKQNDICLGTVWLNLAVVTKQIKGLLKCIHSTTYFPDPGVLIRILAGCTTGAMAVSFAQPTDVVKVRFQAQMNLDGVARRYSGTMQAYKHIYLNEGIRGLWKGAIQDATEIISAL